METTANRAFERNSPFGPVPHLPPAGPLVTAFDPQLERDRFPPPELNSSIPLAYYLRPTGLQIGLSAGPGYPLSEQHRREDGFSVGVTAELEFPHPLRLWADVRYFRLQLDADVMDETIGIPFIESPSDDFRFLKAQLDQQSLQYSLGLRYVFLTDGALQPYLGIGFAAVSFLPHEIHYEFEHLSLDTEIVSQMDAAKHKLLTEYYLLQAGVDYAVSDKFRWSTTLNYRGKPRGDLHSERLVWPADRHKV